MKKKVLITVYNLEIGGIERSLINMLEAFDYESYDVDLMVFDHSGDLMHMVPEDVHILPPCPPYSIFRRPIAQCLKEGYWLTSLIRILCKLLIQFIHMFRPITERGYYQEQLVLRLCSYVLPKLTSSYDLAISYAWPHDIVARNVRAGVKVAWIHTDYSELDINRRLDLHIWNQFDYIASISEAVTHAFLKVYPSLSSKIIAIDNITSPDYIHRMAESAVSDVQFEPARFHLVSVGRLSRAKGFDMAVAALRMLHDRGYTHMRWFIVGFGGDEQGLRQLIDAHGLKDDFILLGKRLNPYPYIRACDIYVQPSRYEGKAVTIAEAMILGKPVLITNYKTAHSQVVDGENGLICDLSAEGLADGIEQLYLNTSLRQRLTACHAGKDYGNAHELRKLYAACEAGKRSVGVI